MTYSFNLGWLFGGLGIMLLGGLIVFFYKPIADNLVNGVSSYEKTKLFGIIVVIIGSLLASNLMPIVISLIANLLFKK